LQRPPDAALLRLDEDEETLARLLLEGMQELKRALRGEPARYYAVRGFEGVRLDPKVEITTPWGVLKAAPEVEPAPGMRHYTPVLLVSTSLVTPSVTSDDSAAPPSPYYPDFWSASSRADILFPLACALGAGPAAESAPVLAWSSGFLPFRPSGGWTGPGRPESFRESDLTPCASRVEDWARIVEERHDPAIDVASHRTVSALSLRSDPADVLIDAVMAWENLVGTETETTFRVSASLGRLLESDPVKRLELVSRLKSIYGTRSRVVHGESVDPQKVAADGREAVSVAISALRASYERGADWLGWTSVQRSTRLLVVE
jgi:hypothetical protein